MSLVESLQRAIDFMEEHLPEPAAIEEIAAQAHLSPFHFQRTFMILTGISVGAYIRRRRLTLAAQDLLQTDSKIIDIAHKYGYETPEAFSKAFRRQHGINPTDARSGAGPLRSYNRLVIQVYLKGAEPMNYRIEERDAFCIVGMHKEFPCDEEAQKLRGIGGFWAECEQSGGIGRLLALNDGIIKGLLGVTAAFDARRNIIDYWIAVEHQGEAPEGLSQLEIPAARWAVFEVQGPVPDAMASAWRRIYGEWFPSHGYKQAEVPPMEVYLEADVTRPDARNEIWVAVE